MTATDSNQSRRRAALLVLAIALLVTAALCLGRRSMVFADYVEIPLYDSLTLATWPWQVGHPDVVLVTIRDHTTWPLADAPLATALSTILQGGPTFIGIDLKRDSPRPDAAGSDSLYQLAAAHSNLIWVQGLPGAGSFAPPPFLLALRERGDLNDEELAFRCPLADFPADARRVVRRAYVSADEKMSLAAVLALGHASIREPDGQARFGQRLEKIGSLPGDAGGYRLRGPAGFHDIGAQFLLKYGPDLDALFPDMGLRDVLAQRPLPISSDPRRKLMPTYPLEDLPAMDTAALRRCFGGKIVLLGTHDPDTAEDEKAVIGHEKLRGIKLHALATAQLLRELQDGEPPVRFADDRVEDLVIALAALVAAACVWWVRLPPLWKSLLFPFGLPAALFGGAVVAMHYGCWVPPGTPMAAAFVAASASLAILLRVESRDRATIYQVLERQVGPEIARRVWAHNQQLLRDGTLPTESFTATAMFSDLRGYSAIAEEFQQADRIDDFRAWLSSYLRAMDGVVQQHHGFIKQFAGDGIFVMFGFPPRAGLDHPQLAVRCAIAMAATVARLNAEMAPGTPPYHVRIGIYTGPVHTTLLGGAGQCDYAFLGPTINKAARLESLRKASFEPALAPVRILVSDPTRAALPPEIPLDPFDVEPVGLDAGCAPEPVWIISPKPQETSASSATSPVDPV